MKIKLNTLESREILRVLGEQSHLLETNVLRKLHEGAEIDPVAQKFPGLEQQQRVLQAPFAPTPPPIAEQQFPQLHPVLRAIYGSGADVTDVPVYMPIVLEPKMQMVTYDQFTGQPIPPVTQADIDTWNEARRRLFETNARMRLRKPNLNVNDPINAEFAAPDLPPGHGVERGSFMPGDRNRAGDLFAGVDSSGQNVFECKNGHGYTQNPNVKGCPTCLIQGGGSSGGGDGATLRVGQRDTSNDIEGEDPF